MFDDNQFEMSEQFSVQYTGIVLPDGTATPSVPGVMIQPSTATVLILDNDGNYCSSLILSFAIIICVMYKLYIIHVVRATL